MSEHDDTSHRPEVHITVDDNGQVQVAWNCKGDLEALMLLNLAVGAVQNKMTQATRIIRPANAPLNLVGGGR